MNCYRCGEIMTLRKIHEYGGYSWAWRCTRCGSIIDRMPTGKYCMKEDPQRNDRIKEASRAR